MFFVLNCLLFNNNGMDFLDILIFLFILFFTILFPIMFFGYRYGIRKKSSDNQNRGCWKAIFIITLIITITVLAGIAIIVLLGAAMTGNLS